MIHWQHEGETLHQGLSIYPPSDKNSAGGSLRIGNRAWRIRYSKVVKKWFFSYFKVDPYIYERFGKQDG